MYIYLKLFMHKVDQSYNNKLSLTVTVFVKAKKKEKERKKNEVYFQVANQN